MLKKFIPLLTICLFSICAHAQTQDDSTEILRPAVVNPDMIPVVTMSESDANDNNGGDQNVSSMLSSSRDIFMSAASYKLGQGGFRYRGYGVDQFQTLINGALINDPEKGGMFWGAWGGLNDVMRSRESSVSLSPSTLSFGGMGGSSNMDTRASTLRKGLSVSYAATNRNYRNRIMLTYASGMLKGGWAVAVSASRRWATQGYEPGTFFDGYSYYVGVDKKFGNKHTISFTSFGTPTKSGASGIATKEAMSLGGSIYYNPNWGYQNGQMRNAKISNRFQPHFILSHEAKLSNKTSILTGAFFSFGNSSQSMVSWNNAPNPAPDYYRYLPSFAEDSTQKHLVDNYLRNTPGAMQIQWDKFYAVNRNSYDSVQNANGISGNTVKGNRSRYIVMDKVESSKTFSINSVFNHTLNNHISLTAGLTYQWERNEHFGRLTDLLGGDYYVDVNQFAVLAYPDDPAKGMNNLNTQNRILKVGDKMGYDYFTNIHKGGAWLQSIFKFNHVDFHVSAGISDAYFWRNGVYKNGLYPDNSQGSSEKLNFVNYSFKGGATYKINGRNYLYANGTYRTEAPTYRDVFAQPMYRNLLVPNVKSTTIYGAELGYNYVSPRLKLKATLFYTEFLNEINTYTFYHDDYRSFVNYSLSNLNKRQYGAEIAADVQIWRGISANFAGSFGRYTYSNQPVAFAAAGNSDKVLLQNETVYMKGFNIGRTPQLATTLGLQYRGKQFYTVGMNVNYYDWMFVEVNPVRRTKAAIDLVPENSPLWNNIISQERLKGQFTLDLNANWNWMLNKNFKALNKTKKVFYLNFTGMITNLTNNRNMVLSGQEQLRFDYNDKNPYKFPTKYKYMHGIGFYIGVAFRMQ